MKLLQRSKISFKLSCSRKVEIFFAFAFLTGEVKQFLSCLKTTSQIFAIRTVEELTSWFGLNKSQMDFKLADTQDNWSRLKSQVRILLKFKEDISLQSDNKASLLAEGVYNKLQHR